MPRQINLLPLPQQITQGSGENTLTNTKLITLETAAPEDLLFTAREFQQAFFRLTGYNWQIVGGGEVPAEHVGLRLIVDDSTGREQGYTLSSQPGEPIRIQGHDTAGVFYGIQTLIQLIQQHGATLPALVIEDWPDLPRRGVMLDISRDRVPTMATLYALVDKLASWKLNELQLYTEHTFAYQNHPVVWAKASPMTAEEILLLDAYCREHFIDLVPNQNSFGHMHRWFEHDRYLPLAETETGFETPWGTRMEHPFSLTPSNPDTVPFLDGLYAELLPNFTSPYFNVGCDETWDLGQGRSKTLCEERGKGRVYLDFLLEIYKLTQKYGRTMMFWGDIINQYPELVPEIPQDTIALEWGYEADHDFPGMSALFAQSGIPFYTCPGTSSWNTIAGRTDNATGNIRSAVENARKHGAIGILNTDWGDNGHWQTPPISYLGFAYGAALSWSFAQNESIDLPAALDAHVFQDKAGVMGQLAYDLGNAYQKIGLLLHNSSALYWAYTTPLAKLRSQSYAGKPDDETLSANLHATIQYIDNTIAPLDRAQMALGDADLIQREFTLAARMLRHGAALLLLQLNDSTVSADDLREDLNAIEVEFRKLWLARSRPGGLEDSTARFEKTRQLHHQE